MDKAKGSKEGISSPEVTNQPVMPRQECADELVARLQHTGVSAADSVFAEVERLKAQLNALQDQAKSTENDAEQQQLSQQKELEELRAKMKEMDVQNSQLAEVERLKAQLNALQDQAKSTENDAEQQQLSQQKELEELRAKMKEMDVQNAQLHLDLQGNDAVARDDTKKLSELALALYKAIINDTGSPSKPKTFPSSVRDLIELCRSGVPAAQDLHNDREQLRRKIKDFELRQQYKDLKGTDKERLEGDIEKLRKALNDKLKETEDMKQKLADSQISSNAALDEAQKTIKDLQVQNEKLRGDLVGTAVRATLLLIYEINECLRFDNR